MLNITRDKFLYGEISTIEDVNIPREASSGSKNWITRGTQIELRRGQYKLALTEILGLNNISGGIVAKKSNGDEVLFVSYDRKVLYFDDTTEEFVEIGSDVLPSGSENDVITFTSITTVSGPQVWLNSPHAGLHKIMVANPGSITAMYDGTKNGRGYCKIQGGRMVMWNYKIDNGIPNKTDVFFSYLANKDLTDFTEIASEAIGGAGITRTGTLAFKAAGAKRTCLQVTFTDGTETFIDDYNGVLTGDLGGTGTINYTTGDYSITFNSAPGAPVTATYRWEDSTSAGLADFTASATRLAGEGNTQKQGDGGSPMMNVFAYNGKFYCFHKDITWVVSISVDDLDWTNQIYRHNVGISSLFGACETDQGIFYVDDSDSTNPQIRKLALEQAGVEVVPLSVSKGFTLNKEKVGVDLSKYSFTQSYCHNDGNIVLVSCRAGDVNDNLLHINKDTNTVDILRDIYAQIIVTYNGATVVGESLSANCTTIFTGLDDNDSEITNYWMSKDDDLDSGKLKSTKKAVLEGLIGPEMKIRLYVSLDNAPFVEILDPSGGAFIDGTGSYVDRTQSVNVGAYTLGRGEVGGGGSGISAYHYMRELKLGQSKFNRIKWKVVAEGIGWASVSRHIWKDVRLKWNKLPPRYV